jgi:hypothetical protein
MQRVGGKGEAPVVEYNEAENVWVVSVQLPTGERFDIQAAHGGLGIHAPNGIVALHQTAQNTVIVLPFRHHSEIKGE